MLLSDLVQNLSVTSEYRHFLLRSEINPSAVLKLETTIENNLLNLNNYNQTYSWKRRGMFVTEATAFTN